MAPLTAQSASFAATVQIPAIINLDSKVLGCQISVVSVCDLVRILSSREFDHVSN